MGQVLAYVEELRKTFYLDPIHRIHSVRGRVKDGESLWKKWTSKVLAGSDDRAKELRTRDLGTGDKIYDAMVERFSDIIGVRVVCNTLAGKSRVCSRLEELGPVPTKQSSRNLFSQLACADQYYKDSGYRSTHFDAKLEPRNWPALALDEGDEDKRLTFEIQVRTILEEAWGEIQHDLLYKKTAATADQRCGGPNEEPSDALFLALSHRLHEADLNVQRLTRQLDPPSDARRFKPSVQESIPTNADVLPVRYRESARAHLLEVERLRRERRYGSVIQTHDAYLARLDGPPTTVHGIIRAERALDYLRQAERSLARREGAASSLERAEADYDAAVAVLGDKLLLLWRRARVRMLRGNRRGATSDLRRAIERSPADEPVYQIEPFYRACLHRSLTSLLWLQAEELASSDPHEAESVKREAFALARHAVELQHEAFQREPKSETCALHYCDVLNNAAWLTLTYKNDPATAQTYINMIEYKLSPALWEHDVYLLGTRLRLKVSVLQHKLTTGEKLEIGQVVEADALRTQLFQALDEEDEYIAPSVIESMLRTVRSLDDVWQSYLGQPPTARNARP